VNFILKSPKPDLSAAPYELSSSRYVKITLNLNELSVLDLIYLLNQSTGYTFLIQKNTVIITPK